LKDFFGHHYLSLQAVSSGDGMDKIIHFEIVRNGQRAYNLSEGERSLIAFCYFVAKLEEIETKGNNPIIWIDDPISSLDGNHIFFTFSIIQSVILTQYDYKQFFLSTHNLTFLKYLRRLNINKRKDGRRGSCCYLTVERNGQESTIKLMPKYLKEHGTEFNHWFARIYNCSEQMSVTDVNYSLFEDFGNNARKFFEIYLYYRYPNDENDGEKLKKFFGDDIVPPILLSKINDEYSHAQGDLENASLPFNEPEVLLAAKCIIKKLQEDGPQYEALINSIK
jgi:wobble nucleotide-excising tRNase